MLVGEKPITFEVKMVGFPGVIHLYYIYMQNS